MTQEQRDDARYEAIMIVNELHKTIDYSVYCRLIDLIDMLGLPDETCTAEYPKPAQHEQVSPTTQSCPVCGGTLESRGGYIRVIIGKRDMTSEVQGASWYCAECDRAWDYGDLPPSNTRQLPQPPKTPPAAAMSSADICTRLRWLILQAEKGSARVEAADWEAVRQACRALEGRVDVAPGFDSARPGKD